MDTVIMDNDTKGTIEYRHSDVGKFLNVGDYIILHNVCYKIFSKTYDVWNNKWMLMVE